jgi:hypothetical protein
VKNQYKGFWIFPDTEMGSLAIQRLEDEDFGRYMRLKFQCWMDEGLPNDHKTLAAWLSMTIEKFTEFWLKVVHLFEETDGRLWDTSLRQQYLKQVGRSKTYSNNRKARYDKPEELSNNCGTIEEQPATIDPQTSTIAYGSGNGYGIGNGSGFLERGAGENQDEEKPDKVPDEWQLLGKRYCEAREKQTGSGFRAPAISYFGGMLRMCCDDDGQSVEAVTELLAWLERSENKSEWVLGLGNTSKGYTHAFRRNFPQLLLKARGSPMPGARPARPALQQDLGMSTRRQDEPLTDADKAELSRLKGLQF